LALRLAAGLALLGVGLIGTGGNFGTFYILGVLLQKPTANSQ
jgi:hypothetical protein